MIRLLLWNALAFASDAHEAGAHGPVSPPWSSIFVQAFNFLFLFAVLVYLLRKTVKAHFAHRAAEYKEMVERAENARREAEAAKREVEERLNKLQAGAERTKLDAQAEADQLRARLQSEAKQMVEKLEAEARRAAGVELEKAKAELRAELLQRALASSTESFSKNLGSTEQKKLQTEFVEKIQVVGG